MKKLLTFAAVTAFSSMMTISAMAGVWKQDSVGWWYDNGNGTYPSNSWQWIDGNNDGVAECYYFDRIGYMLASTTTPDGYQVNEWGAWTQNGIVQARNVKASKQVNYTKSRNNKSSDDDEESSTTTKTTKKKQSQYLLYNKETTYRSGGFSKEKNDTVIGGDIWLNTLHFSSHGALAEYSNDAGYTSLKATVAPSTDNFLISGYGHVYNLVVYGDNGVVLYESDDIIMGETQPFDIDVDISGQSKVTIALTSNQGGVGFVMKFARFE